MAIKPVTFGTALQNAIDEMMKLNRYKVRLLTDRDFINHIDRMEDHFRSYDEIWLSGYFSNAFNKKVKGLHEKYERVDFRILAIDPKSNKSNQEALEELFAMGAKVRIHPNLHARLSIMYNLAAESGQLIIGSYDYNREGLSGENENIGIWTENPELIDNARNRFEHLWGSCDDLNPRPVVF